LVTKPDNRNFRAQDLDRSSIVKPTADSHVGWSGGGGGGCGREKKGFGGGKVVGRVDYLKKTVVF